MPDATTNPDVPGRGRWVRVAVIGIAGLALAWAIAWSVGSQIARRTLTETAERLFDARFEAGAVRYLPPLWLVAQDVALTSERNGVRVAWLRVPSLRVRLASLPLGGLPAIAEVTIAGPVATVLRDRDGVHDLLDLWRGDRNGGGDAVVVPHALSVQKARVEVIDRTGAPKRADDTPVAQPAGAPAFALGSFDVDASAGADGKIAFTLGGGEQRLTVDAAGSIDPSSWQLSVDRLQAQARIGGSDAAPESRTDVTLAGLRGTVDLEGATGRIDDGAITISGTPAIEASALRATVAVASGAVTASDASASVAGGSVRGTLTVRLDPEPSWQASGEATDFDLAQIANRHPQLGGDTVRGRASGSGTFSGKMGAVDESFLASLRGQGRMQAHDGRFYQVPLIAKLLEQAHLSSEGATLSQAAARFRVADATIQLDEAVLGSPTVGVQGSGTVGFDGKVALDMVVVPLGDWRAWMERHEVPVVGGALASLAGKVQSLFGRASAVLYQFHIAGTVQDPKLTPVPVPALSAPAERAIRHLATRGFDADVLAP